MSNSLNIAATVQHHPSRAHLIPPLLDRLNGLDPQVIPDPGGREKGTWRSHRACLHALPIDATHLLVVQDDAIPCDGFADRLREAVADHPDAIVCAFAPGTGELLRPFWAAQKRGDRYLHMPVRTFVPVVCVVYPRHHAEGIPRFAAARRMSVGKADDGIVSTYVRAHRVPVVLTVPCLADHDDSEPSLMGMPHGRGHSHRKAAAFVDTAQDPRYVPA